MQITNKKIGEMIKNRAIRKGEKKCDICNKREDEDGRCGCTNKDSN